MHLSGSFITTLSFSSDADTTTLAPRRFDYYFLISYFPSLDILLFHFPRPPKKSFETMQFLFHFYSINKNSAIFPSFFSIYYNKAYCNIENQIYFKYLLIFFTFLKLLDCFKLRSFFAHWLPLLTLISHFCIFSISA